MLLDAEGEVALLIELALLQAVACGLQGDDQEILGRLSPQGELCTDWLVLFDAEGGQSLLGDRPDWCCLVMVFMMVSAFTSL